MFKRNCKLLSKGLFFLSNAVFPKLLMSGRKSILTGEYIVFLLDYVLCIKDLRSMSRN